MTVNPGNGAADRYQSLLEHIPGMVVYLDLVQPDDPSESLPLYISPQIEELLGYEHAACQYNDRDDH